MNNADSLKNQQRNAIPVHGHLDFAFMLPLPDSRVLALVNGWLFASGLKSLALGGGGKAALVTTHYYPRADVDALHGPCLDPSRKGHGFIGAALLESRPESLFAATAAGIGEIKGAPFRLAASLSELTEFAETIGAPDALKLALLRDVAANLGCARQSAAGVAIKQAGDLPSVPQYSLILPVDGDAALLQTQMLALAEDEIFRHKAEIIYILNGQNQQSLEDVFENFPGLLPLRWLAPAAPVSKTTACNLAADAARGALLAFGDETLIPEKPGWLTAAAKRLAASPGAAMVACAAKDIEGRLLNGFYSLEFTGANHTPVKISIPDSLAMTESPVLPESWLLVTPGAIFKAAGGFDETFLDYGMALADYCERLFKKGSSLEFEPAASLCLLKTATSRASLAERLDGEYFFEKRSSRDNDTVVFL